MTLLDGKTSLRIAADIGGTFTDVACLTADGRLATCKLPSTPGDYGRAILDGILSISADLGVELGRFEQVLHASTIATNAILEGKGAVTALITTEGFRDVLELRRIRVPRLYEPLYQKPAPLVPRRRRYEIGERMGPRGAVLKGLDVAALRALAVQLGASEVTAIAVCFLHSHVNPAHEMQAAAILREMLPDRFLSISHEVLPEIREYERTSTTVVNAYIGPIVTDYLRKLQSRLIEHGVTGRLMMMQSSGGTLDLDRVIAKPATVVESGPAAGVVGAAKLGAHAGYHDLITFDMGGTTAKASLIERGRVSSTDEYEVGGGISLNSALAKGGGYALKLPVIDVSEVGAGGGSIVRIDRGGALKVGPQSAGASPGPACYGAGGTEPTVTDANVVLGYLNPKALAGGTVPIDSALSSAAITQIARPLGRDLFETAYGVHQLVNSTMMRAVKAVSVYRGRDPRDFTLFAFGGNGGIHAAALAFELGMRRVVVPPAAGVFSAVGLLLSDVEISETAAWLRPLAVDDAEALAACFEALEVKVRRQLSGEGQQGGEEGVSVRWRADVRYAGQGSELRVEVPRGPLTCDRISSIRAAFDQDHRRTYGHAQPDQRVDLVALRVVGTLPSRTVGVVRGSLRRTAAIATDRTAYFGAEHGHIATPVIDRSALSEALVRGPLIIEEYEGTTVVPPGVSAHRDPHDNIVLGLTNGV
ncbi:MAG TPA: hydantoinase/oxoprolinase family protein [Steroidobacteraceae bacterium]|nr:hydantoinase/oxoprolinase family protein [Steroidobacteraceae bacterium]